MSSSTSTVFHFSHNHLVIRLHSHCQHIHSHCYIPSQLHTMPKPGRGAVTTRTIVTRPANANKNPMDLEVPSSEEEAPLKANRKRKKKVVKTQEQMDAEERQRDAVLATVSHLEDDMARQGKVHDGTPRRSSAVDHISRHGSYVAPDPPSASAHARPKSRPTAVLSTTEDDGELQPPAKKPKSAAQVEVVKDKAKQAAVKGRVTKSTQDTDFDAHMVSTI